MLLQLCLFSCCFCRSLATIKWREKRWGWGKKRAQDGVFFLPPRLSEQQHRQQPVSSLCLYDFIYHSLSFSLFFHLFYSVSDSLCLSAGVLYGKDGRHGSISSSSHRRWQLEQIMKPKSASLSILKDGKNSWRRKLTDWMTDCLICLFIIFAIFVNSSSSSSSRRTG